jgi:hypothetical protein
MIPISLLSGFLLLPRDNVSAKRFLLPGGTGSPTTTEDWFFFDQIRSRSINYREKFPYIVGLRLEAKRVISSTFYRIE